MAYQMLKDLIIFHRFVCILILSLHWKVLLGFEVGDGILCENACRSVLLILECGFIHICTREARVDFHLRCLTSRWWLDNIITIAGGNWWPGQLQFLTYFVKYYQSQVFFPLFSWQPWPLNPVSFWIKGQSWGIWYSTHQ